MSSTDPTQLVPVVAYAARSAKTTENEQTAQQLQAIRGAVERESSRLIQAEHAEDDRSGYKGDRGPELERAMAAAVALADTHATVELWVWASNRLARGSGLKGEARSVLEVFAQLRRHGVTLRSVTDDQFLSSPMLVGFAAEQANKYSADLSVNVTRGKDSQWERGDWLGGPIPDGYLSDGAKGLMVDPVRERIVRRLWDEALAGRAAASIARTLNADGLRTKSGGAWSRRRVQDTLANAAYAGQLVRWRGTEREARKPGRWPTIVTLAEWEAVHRQAAQRDVAASGRPTGGRPSPRFLLATQAKCHRCGSTMYSRLSPYKRKDGSRARAYLCSHVVNGTGLCDTKPVDAEAVDAEVIDRLPRYIAQAEQWLAELGSDRQGAGRRAEAELQAAERHTHELELREEAYRDRYMAEDPDSEKAEALLSVLSRVRTERKQADADIRRAQAELDSVTKALAGDSMAVALRALKDDLARGAAGSVADFNRRLREHFEAFVIDADGTPVPLWRVQVPATVAAHVTDTLDSDAVAAYIARRAEELDLVGPVETGEG